MELNIQPDYVHLVASIPPKYAVSEFRGYLRDKMALRLFQQYESLGRRYWGRHLWAIGNPNPKNNPYAWHAAAARRKG